MGNPEAIRELADVTIRVEETGPGFFVASFHPASPQTHLARSGFTVNTKAGVRGRTLAEALDWAETHWRLNYPVAPDPTDDAAS
jgi:hypothetical protein